MRKKALILIMFFVVAIFCGSFCFNKEFVKVEALNVRNLISAEQTEKNYDTIFLGDEITENSLMDAINRDKQSKQVSTQVQSKLASKDNSKVLDFEEIAEICDSNDYNILKTANGYSVYYKFQLKTLILNSDIEGDFGAESVKVYDDVKVLKFATEEETKQAFEKIQEKNIDVFADSIVTLSSIDNFQTGNFNSWGADAMDIYTYREYYQTNGSSKQAVVAVIDSGINTAHEMFEGRFLTKNGSIVGYCDDNVTTKYTYSGYAFEDDNNETLDASDNWITSYIGHGTHVSGTICELTPTNVKILPMKVFNNRGSASFDDIYEALNAVVTYANTYNIVAVNMSLGGVFSSQSSASSACSTFNTYFSKLKAKNILPIVAAGNENIDTSYTAPGGCGDNAVVVSALTQVGSQYEFHGTKNELFEEGSGAYSNYGSSVDVAAAGTYITSASIGTSATKATSDRYVILSGTSMATPHVTAAVALLCLDGIYYDGSTATYTDEIIEKRLFALTKDLGTSGKDVMYGHGMISFTKFQGNISFNASNTSVTYDGNYHNISVEVSGVSNYSISYGFTASNCNITDISTNEKFKNFTNGAMTVYFKINADNCLDTYGSATLTISKAQLEINLINQWGYYGEEPKLIKSFDIENGEIFGSDDIGLELSTEANSTKDVGKYPLTATSTNKNYNITINPSTYEVKKRPITITLLEQSFTYGDPISLSTTRYEITSELGLVNDDDLNLQLSTNAEQGNPVDKYEISFKSANNNYDVTSDVGDLYITEREISICVERSGVYGDPVDLSADESSLNISSLIVGDVLGLTLLSEVSNISPVGTYDIIASITNENYKLKENTGSYVIYKRVINIKALDQTHVYGEEFEFAKNKFEIENLANNDDITVTLSYDENAFDVGEYEISVGYSETDVTKNYTIKTTNANLIITEREITIEAFDQTFEYGYEVKLVEDMWEVVSGEVLLGDKLEVALNTDVNNMSTVKTYEESINISVGGDDKSNYSISYVKGDIIITQRKITIQVLDQESIFGKAYEIENNYKVVENDGVVNGDDLNVKVVPTEEIDLNTKIGEYVLTLTYDNDNYDVEILNGTLFVRGREVVITIIPQTFTYGMDIQSLLDQTKVSSNEDLTDIPITLSTEADNFSSVGKYAIVATTTNANIKLSYDGQNKLEIIARTLQVELYEQSFTYGEINIDQTMKKVGQTINGDEVVVTLVTNAKNTSNVGDGYLITATTDDINYVLSFEAAKAKITKKELIINIEDQKGVYGSINFNDTLYSLSQDAYNDDNLNIQLITDATDEVNIGDNYYISFTYENDNYLITGDNATFTIVPREIEINVFKSIVYGQEVVLTESDYSVVSENKVVNDDKLNLIVENAQEQCSNVGEHNIEVVSKNSNYVVKVNTAQVAISQLELKITIGDKTIMYGDEVNVSDVTVSYDVELVGDDVLTVEPTTKATSQYDIGMYDITANVSGEAIGNYIIEIVDGTLHIDPRVVEIEIEDQEGTYGYSFSPLNLYKIVSTRGFVNGDDLNIQVITDADENSPVGEYSLTLSYTEDPNYKIIYENAVFKVIADIIIVIENQTFEYGEDIQTLLDQTKFHIKEKTSDIDKTSLGVKLLTDATRTSVVNGEYKIYAEPITNPNYNIAFEQGTLTITPRKLTILIENQQFTYGAVSFNKSKYQLSDNVVNGDVVLANLSTEANNLSNVGSYPINYTLTNANYQIANIATANVVVAQRQLTIRVLQSCVYGENIVLDNNDYVIVDGIKIAGDDMGVELSTNAKKYDPVDDYSVQAKPNNSNYSIQVSLDSKLSIIKRPISISISQNKYYGDENNLKSDKYTIVSGSIVRTDSLQLVLSTNARVNSNVGTYSIDVESFNSNYDVDLVSGVLTIEKRIMIIETIKSDEYGNYFALDNDYEIKQGSVAFETDVLNINFSTEANSLSPVGDYKLILTYKSDNYNIELTPASHFTVLKRNIIISIHKQNSVYGEDVVLDQNAYTIISNSIVNDDIVNITLRTDATKDSGAGTYKIEGSADNNNYNVEFINGTFTVEKRQLKISLNKQKISRGITFELDQNAWQIVEGEIVEGDDLKIELFTNAKMFSTMGNYKIRAKYDNDNYNIEFVEGKLFLNISAIDVGIVIIFVGLIAFVVVKVKKHRKAKKDNQKLFDKWIKW